MILLSQLTNNVNVLGSISVAIEDASRSSEKNDDDEINIVIIVVVVILVIFGILGAVFFYWKNCRPQSIPMAAQEHYAQRGQELSASIAVLSSSPVTYPMPSHEVIIHADAVIISSSPLSPPPPSV